MVQPVVLIDAMRRTMRVIAPKTRWCSSLGDSSLTQYRFVTISRPELVQRVEGSGSALVVLQGGAGAGKTFLAREIAQRNGPRGIGYLWVSLSENDAGLSRFWERIFAEYVRHDSERAERFAGPAADTLDAPDAINEKLRSLGRHSEPCMVILENIDRVLDDDVAESLLSFMESYPRWRVVVTTRSEIPLVTGISARVRIPVRTIIERELAFTVDDVEQLISRRSELDDEHRPLLSAQAVHRVTHGWPLAVHAFIEEWRAGRDPSAVIECSEWMSAFASRILDRLHDDEREIVTILALVPDLTIETVSRILNLSPELVADRLDARRIPALAARLDDDGQRRFSFPEAVRAELEQHVRRAAPEREIFALYRRAARALGESHRDAAMRAAVRGEGWEELAQLLLTGPISSVMWGSRRDSEAAWLRRIPVEVRRSYPVISAHAAFQGYAYPEGRVHEVGRELRAIAGPWLADAAKAPGLRGALVSELRMIAARLCGNEAPSISAAADVAQALSMHSLIDSGVSGAKIGSMYLQKSITYLHAHEYIEAEDALQKMAAWADDITSVDRVRAVSIAAVISALRGFMPEVTERLLHADSLIGPPGWRSSHAGAGFRIASAIQALEHGHIDEADAHLEEMRECWSGVEIWPYLVIVKAMSTEMRHGTSSALAYLDQELELRRRGFSPAPAFESELHGLRARLERQSGRRGPSIERRYSAGIPALYELMARHETVRSRAMVSRMLAQPELLAKPRRHAELLLVQAHLAHRDGDRDLARSATQLAHNRIAAQGMTLPYRTLTGMELAELKEYEPLIDPSRGAAGNQNLAIMLSEAERRALVAVARHGSTPRAAESLFLSRHTVRNQLTSAYRRLGAHNFEDALRVARESGLLRDIEES